ncbi:MAG: phage terminase large subunit [Deltaproteobacteria bacterium]|jgi:predicted phage terminase large subunit-like protein|nr:phage terminase large subunit [Deltaproteobacteria bacterium]
MRSLAGSTLANFVRWTRPGYLMGAFHEAVCNRLDAFLNGVWAGRSPRVMITAPPRHGKSEMVSRCFPAYAFGKYPDITMISTSYSAGLTASMNRDVQNIIDSGRYRDVFPLTRLAGGGGRPGEGVYRRNSDVFEIVGYRGSYRAAGVGGGITGQGGHCLLVDDPVKNREEADSPAIRDKIYDWYTSTLHTRLAPGGGIVIIQTRWHEDDLAGRLLEADRRGEGEGWEVLNFPAVAEADEGWRREGEALHPERYPLSELESARRALGPRDWASLYQQRPAPDTGAVFQRKWLRYWMTLPARWDRMVISWDMTFKESRGSDYVAGQAWGFSGGDAYLLDQVRGRMGFAETLSAFRALARRWPQAYEKLVEAAANGPAVTDSLRHEVPGIVPVQAQGSKLSRAHAATAAFESGHVYLPPPERAPWVGDFVAELLSFPSGAHDDQVDAMAQALRRLFERPPIRFSEDALATARPLWRGGPVPALPAPPPLWREARH